MIRPITGFLTQTIYVIANQAWGNISVATAFAGKITWSTDVKVKHFWRGRRKELSITAHVSSVEIRISL